MSTTKSIRTGLAVAGAAAAAALALAAPASAANGVTIYSMDGLNTYQPFKAQVDASGYDYIANHNWEQPGAFPSPYTVPGFSFKSTRRGNVDVTLAYNEYGPPTGQARTPNGSLAIEVDGAQMQALRVETYLDSVVRVYDAEGNLLDRQRLGDRHVVGYGAGIVADPGTEIGRVTVTDPSTQHEVTQTVVGYGTGAPLDAEGDPDFTAPPSSGGGKSGGGILCGLFGC